MFQNVSIIKKKVLKQVGKEKYYVFYNIFFITERLITYLYMSF